MRPSARVICTCLPVPKNAEIYCQGCTEWRDRKDELDIRKRRSMPTVLKNTQTRRSKMTNHSHLVKGSTLSLLPRICAVEAVGIGATSSEFRRPCSAILAFRPAQSCLSEGVTPQRSNWRRPSEAGEPSYVSYVPSSLASYTQIVVGDRERQGPIKGGGGGGVRPTTENTWRRGGRPTVEKRGGQLARICQRRLVRHSSEGGR